MACILITIDCGRADHVSGDEVPTPNLDRFREEAVTYARCYAHANVTLPSHRTLLTGLWPSEHGVVSNFADVPLPGDSLPGRLESRGVSQEAFVSINFLELLLGRRVGGTLDAFFKTLNGSESFSQAKVHGTKVRLGLRGFRRDAHHTLEAAWRWIKGQPPEANPFLFIHLFDAHTPYQAPKTLISKELSRYGDSASAERTLKSQLEEKQWFCGDSGSLAERRPLAYQPAVYRAALRFIDLEIGRFFERLRKTGHWGRSTVAITADHGENLGEHGVYCGHQLLFDETVHVPCFLKYPDGKDAGSTVEFSVGHRDLAQSLAGHYNLKLPGQGLPLAALNKERNQFSENAKRYHAALRCRSWTYIRPWILPTLEPKLRNNIFKQTGWIEGKGLKPVELPGRLAEILEELEGLKIADEGVDFEIEAQLRGLGYM